MLQLFSIIETFEELNSFCPIDDTLNTQLKTQNEKRKKEKGESTHVLSAQRSK